MPMGGVTSTVEEVVGVALVLITLDEVGAEVVGMAEDVVDEDVLGGSGAPPRGPPVAGSRYQLAGASPRHSPRVVNWKPRSLPRSIIH
jgi:hypothetical protein